MNAAKLHPPIHRSDLRPEHYAAIVDVLSGIEGVQSITLFGSRARGDHRFNSDVDLLLRGDDLGFAHRAEAFRKLRGLRISHRIDVLIDRWVSEPAVWANIEREGVVLWEHPLSPPPPLNPAPAA